jgi:hypothetical protein
MMPGDGGDVNTTLPLILSIVSIFCCCPLGVAPIIFAIVAINAKTKGELESARSNAKIASILSYILIGFGFLSILGAALRRLL